MCANEKCKKIHADPCKDFFEKGHCKFKNNCKYSHD